MGGIRMKRGHEMSTVTRSITCAHRAGRPHVFFMSKAGWAENMGRRTGNGVGKAAKGYVNGC